MDTPLPPKRDEDDPVKQLKLAWDSLTSSLAPILEMFASCEFRTTWNKLVSFLEHPLFLVTVGIVCSLVGFLFYTPILIVCGFCILLAFHRAGVVKGKPIQTQLLSYAVLFIITTSGLLYVGTTIRKNVYIPTVAEIAEAVARRVASHVEPVGQPPKEIPQPTLRQNTELRVLGVVAVDVFIQEVTKSISYHSHGLAFIARLVGGKESVFVGGIDLKGKVHLRPEEFTWYANDILNNKEITMAEVDALYDKRKPYRIISWHSWPSDIKESSVKIEPNQEKFVRFTLVEARPGSGIWFRWSPLSDYVGYDDGSKKPKFEDDLPEPRIFFVGAAGPTLARRIRDDFTNGSVEWRLRIGRGTVKIPASKIIGVRRVLRQEWDQASAQVIFFGENDSKPYAETPLYRR